MENPAAILTQIGNTPLVEVTRLETGPCRLFLKLESQNPGGSIKDRIALTMVEAAEREGHLRPGGTLIEATAGNTGLGLALIAAAKGYRLILVVPDKMALEKISHLKALGAEIHWTRSDVNKGHPEYYQDIAERLSRDIPGSFYVNQFANPANPIAHETGTGPEILRQMGGDLDAMVVGVGSGGTLTGLGRYFRAQSPKTKMILADPKGSILADLVKTGQHDAPGSWVVEGIGEDFVPPNCDLSLVAGAYTIPDQEALLAARELLRREGILAGSSSGTLLAAALRYCREQTEPQRVVTLVCDTGNKYLSKLFNDAWMGDQGYLPRAQAGDLRDLISRRHDRGEMVTVSAEDTLLTAYKRMRIADVSQLPVVDGPRIVGLLDESDLLMKTLHDPASFKDSVASAMNSKLETIAPATPIDALPPIFDRGHVALVVEEGRFLGLIARIDLLNYLRRQAA